MPRPYIGVTGIAHLDEIQDLARLRAAVTLPTTHDLAVGVIVSDATLRGEAPTIARYPDRETAYALLQQLTSWCVPVVHYNTRTPEDLEAQLSELLRRDGIHEAGPCRRLQLNVRRPDPGVLGRIKDAFPGLTIVLQTPLWVPEIGAKEVLAQLLADHAAGADYFLIDPSGGRGTLLSDGNLELAAAARDALGDESRIAIAGGLDGDNVRDVVARVRAQTALRTFSIDAEGKLRGGTSGGRRVGDRLNPDKVKRYLEAACEALPATAGKAASDATSDAARESP